MTTVKKIFTYVAAILVMIVMFIGFPFGFLCHLFKYGFDIGRDFSEKMINHIDKKIDRINDEMELKKQVKNIGKKFNSDTSINWSKISVITAACAFVIILILMMLGVIIPVFGAVGMMVGLLAFFIVVILKD